METGLSCGTSAIFNDPTGLSMTSIHDPLHDSPATHNMDSSYTAAISRAVTDNLFGQHTNPRVHLLTELDSSRSSTGHPQECTQSILECTTALAEDLTDIQISSASFPSTLHCSSAVNSHSENVESTSSKSKPDYSSYHRLPKRAIGPVNESDTECQFSDTVTQVHAEVLAKELSSSNGDITQSPASKVSQLEDVTLALDTSSQEKLAHGGGDKTTVSATSNGDEVTLSSLGTLTPGQPACESSHIQRAGAASSEKSTHYLSIDRGKSQGFPPTSSG